MAPMILNELIIFLFLLLVNFSYLKLATKYGIVDKPNIRSSHNEVTVRGGGILFPIAVILWWISVDFLNTWMVLGIIWISAVSMLDDMFTISRKLRFVVQFLALSMAFYDLGVFEQESWWFLPVLYFVGLGIINAINFMDGINGITGLYGLVFFGSLLAINEFMPIFDEILIRYVVLSILVFLIFNFRKKALMFAGDIGSISIAYLMIYFLVQWYLASNNWTIILFLLIYGADSFITLGQRLIRGENVALPHRTHLYQIFANQLKKNHVMITLVYAGLQLGFNMVFYIIPQSYPGSAAAGLILVITAVLYLMIKVPLTKKYQVYEK
jgi:UDP-N-acetylmuramyl pentapeptide phosphotransferase/UDP-N-acetylglucosamine-1-phosphate transferase